MAKKAKTALELALKLLQGRDKSRAQLEAQLVARGHAAPEIAAALRRCTELGYLDDEKMARAVAQRLYQQGHSRHAVTQKLSAKGLDPDAADALAHDERASARALLSARGLKGPKAARLLAARGFEEDLISELVDVSDADE